MSSSEGATAQVGDTLSSASGRESKKATQPGGQPPGSSESPVPGYKILGEIGSGPRGTVYRASDGKRVLALKIHRPGALLDLTVAERFLKTSPSRIRHPSLVSLESVGKTEDGRAFVAMPILRGDTLEKVIADLRLGATDAPSLSPLSVGPGGETHPQLPWYAALLFARTAEGLALAHREGIVHGRLSPRNLIFTPAGHLVITDFGGKADSSDAETAAIAYRAPEQLEAGARDAGKEADVFALGVGLYELLARRLPFEAGDASRLRTERSGSPAVPPQEIRAEVPPELGACVLKAIAREPSRRYRDAAELAADLKRFVYHERPEACQARAEGLPAEIRAPATDSIEAPARVQRLVESPPSALLREAEILQAPIPVSRRRKARKLLWRSAAACALLAVLLGAWQGGQRLQREWKRRSHESAAVSFVRSGEYTRALEEARTLVSVDPGHPGASVLEDYARNTAALFSLEEAVGTMDANVPRALQAATRASSFRPGDGELVTFAAKLEEKALIDPLARDLSDPRAAVTAAALKRLDLEIRGGQRPRDDARLAARLLHSPDPSIVRGALETLSLEATSEAIIRAFPLEGDGPEIPLTAEGFATLHGILESMILPSMHDEEAGRLLCLWDLETCRALDTRPRPTTILVPPNLAVELREGQPRDFTARWMRVMAKLDPVALVEAAPGLSREEGLLSPLISALSCAGSVEARHALARIARESYLVGGHEALEALRDLGDHPLLLDIARSDLPAPYREIAVSFLGEDFAELCLEDLKSMASRSPEPSIRKLALRFLSTCDRPEALGAIGPALDDPELKGQAMEWLSRTAPDSVAELLLELLCHPDFAVRSRAARLLASASGPEIPPRLLIHLLSARRETREAALAALRLRGDLSRWAGDLPSLLTSPGALLLEKARELGAASRAALRGLPRPLGSAPGPLTAE